MSWEPLEEWHAEQPQRCTVCGDALMGREASYIPNMCLHEGCPGPPAERPFVLVSPAKTALEESDATA